MIHLGRRFHGRLTIGTGIEMMEKSMLVNLYMMLMT